MELHKGDISIGYDAAAFQISERKRARSLLETLRKAEVEAQIRRTGLRHDSAESPQPLTLREIQTEVLDPDTLLLEYSLGTDQSFLWAVTQTSVTAYYLPKRREIEETARHLYDLLDARNEGVKDVKKADESEARIAQADAQYPLAAANLSQMLLAPAMAQLGNKRLLIVTEGVLQFIPFSMLPITSQENANAYRPLIVEHEIVNLPSASTLSVLRREVKDRRPADRVLAVLADPVFESNDRRIKFQARTTNETKDCNVPSWLKRSAQDSGVTNGRICIARLPGTRREGKQILSLVPAALRKQAFDFDASREAATDPELGRYRYLHFATHGFLDSIHPELSAIVLSLFDARGAPQDGFLRANEIFKLKLAADVVVLSACQTGLGKDVKGEGLIGLTRGFMYAGAPRVVVTLWSVDDVATAELMTRFYRSMLRENMSAAKALQAAQVSMLKEKRFGAAFYWAGFTLQGEWR
jgi:CHAT domain-containing protein